MMASGHQVSTMNAPAMLDGLAGVGFAARQDRLLNQVDALNRAATGISLAILITGSQSSITELRAALFRFSIDVRTIAIRVDPHGDTGFRPVGSSLILTVPSLDELAQVMWAVTQ